MTKLLQLFMRSLVKFTSFQHPNRSVRKVHSIILQLVAHISWSILLQTWDSQLWYKSNIFICFWTFSFTACTWDHLFFRLVIILRINSRIFPHIFLKHGSQLYWNIMLIRRTSSGLNCFYQAPRCSPLPVRNQHSHHSIVLFLCIYTPCNF